jgi:hypothetical protein
MKNLLTFMLCLALSYPGHCQTKTLPKPSGKHSIGINYLHFTDDSRKELFDNTQKSYREITVKSWYPTDEKSNLEPYLSNVEFAIKYCQFPEIYRDLKTNSSRDVPVSSKEKEYPILLFSHGWGEHYSQNSILMEELASHGYIIFSIAHHFECRYSAYPDGQVIHPDIKSLRFQKILRELQNPKSMKLIHKMYNASNDKERMQVFLETSSTLPTLLKESPQYWAEDLSFFLDRLKDINRENKIFKGKLNLDKIGVFGMSMGGIASGEICLSDKRVKACINIDGGLYASALDRTIQTPFLFLNSKRFLGYGQLFTSKSITDCYSLSVKNSDHYNFTDYSIYPSPLVMPLIGTIDGNRIIEIMNVMVLAFFDKYLKENKDIDLIRLAKEFSEIVLVTNIDIN